MGVGGYNHNSARKAGLSFRESTPRSDIIDISGKVAVMLSAAQ
jgi:hypothetical protein